MRRFIITEEEKNSIRGLYEKIGDKLSPEGAQSKKAEYNKKIAQFLNQYYKINLPAAQTGNYNDKDFNDYLKKFLEEKGIPVRICKTGDGYCPDGSDGEVGPYDREANHKFHAAMESSTTGSTTTNQPQQTQKDKINTTNDRSYDYKLSNGKYFYSKKNMNQWFEAKGKSLEAIKTKVKFV